MKENEQNLLIVILAVIIIVLAVIALSKIFLSEKNKETNYYTSQAKEEFQNKDNTDNLTNLTNSIANTSQKA